MRNFLIPGSFVISDSAQLACDRKGTPHRPTKLPKDADVLASYILILSLDFLSTESGLYGQRFLPPSVTYKIECVAIQILMEAHVWSSSSSRVTHWLGIVYTKCCDMMQLFYQSCQQSTQSSDPWAAHLLWRRRDLVAGFGHCTGHIMNFANECWAAQPWQKSPDCIQLSASWTTAALHVFHCFGKKMSLDKFFRNKSVRYFSLIIGATHSTYSQMSSIAKATNSLALVDNKLCKGVWMWSCSPEIRSDRTCRWGLLTWWQTCCESD